jgi:hypothetical protein
MQPICSFDRKKESAMTGKGSAPGEALAKGQRALSLVNGYQTTCVIAAAAKLGVFDVLDPNERKTLEACATELKLDARRLQRLLRALAAIGLVEWKPGSFVLTEDGALFRATGPLSAFPLLIAEQYMSAWAHLDHSVSSGEPAFAHLFGMSAWEHRKQNPALNTAFNRMTESFQARAVSSLLDKYDWSRARCVVDVGGGNGHLLAGFLTRFAEAKGVLFEQPEVIEIARPIVANRGVAGRCELVGGSFFDDVIPRGGTHYVLQHVLHNWDDASCIAILENCRKAMPRDARLLVLEHVLPSDTSGPAPFVMLDLHMMSVLGGSVRTLAEYDALLGGAGFERTQHLATGSNAADIIEAVARP